MTELPREILDGAGVRLREPVESDADDIAAACQDPITQRFLPALPYPYTRQDALAWINEGAQSQWRTGGAAFVVVDPATDRLLGCVGIHRVVPQRAQGEVGYWVAPWARGRGVARAGTATVSTWAFLHGFGRMELLTESENAASQRVALAAGYQFEGVRRGAGPGRGAGLGRATESGSGESGSGESGSGESGSGESGCGCEPQPASAAQRSLDCCAHDLLVWARLRDDPPGPTPRLLPDLPGGQLSDGIVALRPLRAADVDELFRLYSLPEVVATTVPPEAPDRAATAQRCAHAESRWLIGERADLTIRDAATGGFAGNIGLYYREPGTRQAMIGYCLLPEWRGRGYATRATGLLAQWAFKHTNIARLIAGTAPGNVASQRVLERVGFIREGLQRGRLPAAHGGRADDLLYGLLPADLTTPTR